MTVKAFTCCGSNEWLLSRSDAWRMVHGFRDDYREDRRNQTLDWFNVIGFCTNCGNELTDHKASKEKGWKFVLEYQMKRMRRSIRMRRVHKIKRHGGFSKRQLKSFKKSPHVDEKMMAGFYERQMEAYARGDEANEEQG